MRTSILRRSIVPFVPLFFAACGNAPLAEDVATATAALDAKADTAATDITAAQQKTVLRLLNNICGDTWCDGDWFFTFEKITCKLTAGTCTWTALIEPSVPVASPVPVYWRSCKVSGIHAFTDLVNTASSGYQSLVSSFYDASTDCVWEIEPKLPPYTPLP